MAVSADGKTWFLLNASPDLRQQIEASGFLQPPAEALRGSPIAGVVLTNGDVDAVAGLLVLREGHPFVVRAAAPVMDVLADNPIFEVLAPGLVRRDRVALETETRLDGADGARSGLLLTLFAVPGKVPLYRERPDEMPALVTDGTTVGAEITDGARRLLFVPSCAAMTPALASRLGGADLVFFDATLWRDDEMIRLGIGGKTGRRMGHMSLSGPAGTLAAFKGIAVGRKVLLHINNTNPILLADSPESAEVRAAGWTVAEDGMRFVL